MLYLEHIIFERKIESEEYHTHLALLYYERLLEVRPSEVKENDDDDDDANCAADVPETDMRERFRQLIKSSHLLRLQLLLGKLKSHPSGFEYEEALLHAKLGDYSSALKVSEGAPGVVRY